MMHTKEIEKNLFLVDLETGGFKNLIASYVLIGKQTTIVETGPSSSIPNLLSGLKELDVKVEDVAYVALSHVHLDHGGGTGTLLKSLPNAKVLVHPRGVPHLVNPKKLWLQSKEVLGLVAEIFGEPQAVPEDRIIAASDGTTLDVGKNVRLTAVETLGHASHNLSYHEPLYGGVFSGDTAGIYLFEFDAVVPTTPPPFRLDATLASLDKLASLKPSALYYSHFGKVSDAMNRLQEHALQLRLWGRVAKEEIGKKHGLKEVQERILVEDKVMQNLAGFIRSHPIYSEVILGNSVQGFIDFAEKSQT
jgi:glyoxylase-like metal-dependent hydrolase (beta-lactamase superfamily II)